MAETSPKTVAEIIVTEEEPQIDDIPVDKAKLVSPLKPQGGQEDKPCDTAASNGDEHRNGTENNGTMETSEEHKETTDRPCSSEDQALGSSDVAASPSKKQSSGEENGGKNQATDASSDDHTEVPEKMVESPRTDSTEPDTAENDAQAGCPSTIVSEEKTGSPKASGVKEGLVMEQEAAVEDPEKVVESPKAAASSECSAL